MKQSKNSSSKIAANNRYTAKAYDAIPLRIKRGNKTILQAYAASQGESLNGYIKKAIFDRYLKETGEPLDL